MNLSSSLLMVMKGDERELEILKADPEDPYFKLFSISFSLETILDLSCAREECNNFPNLSKYPIYQNKKHGTHRPRRRKTEL
jgi:hypothetical protein